MKNIMKRLAVFVFLAAGVLGCLYFGNSTVTAQKSDAATIYKTNCASCHGKDGQAKSLRGKLLKAPNLTDSTWQSDVSDEHISNIITNGRKKMPAFGKKLSEKEIDSLVAYIRGLKR